MCVSTRARRSLTCVASSSFLPSRSGSFCSARKSNTTCWTISRLHHSFRPHTNRMYHNMTQAAQVGKRAQKLHQPVTLGLQKSEPALLTLLIYIWPYQALAGSKISPISVPQSNRKSSRWFRKRSWLSTPIRCFALSFLDTRIRSKWRLYSYQSPRWPCLL